MKGGIELPRTSIGVTRWRRFRATIDWPLTIAVVLIAAIGLLNLYSATRGTQHKAKFDQQVAWMVVGVIGFAIATMVDYRAFLRVAWIGLGVVVVLLVVVTVLGKAAEAKGSTRWIKIGGVGIQPTELAKLAVIMVLARVLQETDASAYRWQSLAARGAALFMPVILIAIQPDLGSAILLTLVILTVGYLAMPDVWPMVQVTLAGLMAIPVVWENMHAYQKQRILAFLDPSSDPTGSGWHTLQSISAVGSGKIIGKGFMDGTQSQFNFLPEHWTDFPFSVWAEEWGFIGSVVLLLLYAFLLLWILNVAMRARDRTGAVICVGVAAMTFWHVVVNVAMVLGLAPVVGVTLPFVSYGGSSLVTFFIAMGLVASVSLRKHGY
ncbi:MAG: rod shape-determining protein RodA [Deltaproteobacteria bacterium]|nr:rod shape-determining protein RodA [Deltaproteobacteria bacterium]